MPRLALIILVSTWCVPVYPRRAVLSKWGAHRAKCQQHQQHTLTLRRSDETAAAAAAGPRKLQSHPKLTVVEVAAKLSGNKRKLPSFRGSRLVYIHKTAVVLLL